MYCPNCGAAEQSVESFCRHCGLFLPDFRAATKSETPPEKHIQINSFFSLATAIVSFSLAIVLYVSLIGREGTPVIIYLVFGFLTAITVWQVQTFVRTRMLKKQFEKLKPRLEESDDSALEGRSSPGQLNEANYENVVPASVTERTTRNLSAPKRK